MLTSNLSLKRTFGRIQVDLCLFICLLLIATLGLVTLYSSGADPSAYQKQGIRMLFAFGMMLVLSQCRISWLKLWAFRGYLLCMLGLIFVLWAGYRSHGAQRWIDLGLFRIQPAEFMKLSLPIYVAYLLDPHQLPPNAMLTLKALLAICLPTVLIFLQPDLGSAILIALSGLAVLYLAGIRFRWILTTLIVGLMSLPLLWMHLHAYQKQRILTLLNPERDPLGSGYHIIQSKIAIGSGGWLGKGWLQGTQSQLEFLPERSTDFIFAVLSEEFGFIGVIVLLFLYTVVIYRSILISVQATDTFSRLLAGSITLTFFVYVFVNIGMNTGMLPVVGVPLPLMSYGGTSLICLMAGFGILMSIQNQRVLVRK